MTFYRTLLLGILASSSLALGCTEPTPLPAGAAFEVGSGDKAFEPLGAGATVPVVHGFQGGTHIWFSARFKGIDNVAALTYTIEDEDGSSIGDEAETMIAEDADAEGWHTVTGLSAIIEDDTPQGLRVVLRGHLEDDTGHEMDASAKAVVKGEDEGSFDEGIEDEI